MAKKKKEPEAAEENENKESQTTTEGGEEGAEGGAKKGKKKLVFIAGGLVLVIVIVAGLLLSGVLGGDKKEEGHEGTEAVATDEHGKPIPAAVVQPVYYELPEFLVNLNATGAKVSFLKMSVTLELRDQLAVATMDANKPRIQDTFNTYLRELRASDIQGSAGIYRLRTELIARLNGTIEEGIVKDILFGEIIVQ